MKLYFAPLEGITGFAYRNAHQKIFLGIDKYFAPFIAPNYTHHFKAREIDDIDPRNNSEINLIPQILSNRAEDFIWAVSEIYRKGYREINLNLGCPMPTVVRKGRGSGQLRDLDSLDRFLEDICNSMDQEFGLVFAKQNKDTLIFKNGGKAGNNTFDVKDKLCFSIKTRIGVEDTHSIKTLVDIYNRYPIAELIVHPRLQKDLYNGRPDLETFKYFLDASVHPIVYNGDICSPDDYLHICSLFPECNAVMIGRGLIANPALAREIAGGARLQKEELRKFHDEVFSALRQTLPGPAPLLGKMKELWFYMGRNFDGADKALKEVKKARTIPQYQAAVRMLFVQGNFVGEKAG